MSTHPFQTAVEGYVETHPGVFKTTRMGNDLWAMLKSMGDKGGWSTSSGWTWSNTSTTTRMCESLVKRGFVTAEDYVVRTTRGGQYGGVTRRRYITDPIIVEIYRKVERERERERAEARRPQEIANAQAVQQTKAHRYAVDLLIWFHQVEYDELMQQYKDEHPVEVA